MNSYNTDIFFSNHHNMQSVHFESLGRLNDHDDDSDKNVTNLHV